MPTTKVWITRPKKKGPRQVPYRLRWREPIVDENGQPTHDKSGQMRFRTLQESTGTKDKKTAEVLAQRKFEELNHVATVTGREERITLEQLSEKDEQWLRNRQRAEGTVYLSNLALRHFKEVVGESTPVAEIGSDHIEAFISDRNKNVGPVAVNRELSNLRATFNRAVKVFKILQETPFKEVRMIDVPDRPIRPLSNDEERKLLTSCANDLELDVYVRLALDTGCRAGELSNLLWEQLDLKEGTGTVECSSLWRSKTKRNRFIAFTPGTARRLRKWRLQRVGRPFVFREGDQPARAHYRRMRDRFDKAVKRSGIRRRTLQDLRKTVATRLAVAGINQKVAAAFLGHRDIATTARFYQEVENDVIKDAVMKMRGTGTE